MYICVFSFCFKSLLGTFSLLKWILFIGQMDLFHSQHKTVWPIENKTSFAVLIQTHSHWTVDSIIFYRSDYICHMHLCGKGENNVYSASNKGPLTYRKTYQKKSKVFIGDLCVMHMCVCNLDLSGVSLQASHIWGGIHSQLKGLWLSGGICRVGCCSESKPTS